MKVTMKDIAKKANVSITTVSLVLNNKPGRVSPEMREKIKQIAKDMHYVPNYTAKQLVTKKSYAIGIIVPDLENYFFATMVSRLQEIIRDSNYFLLVATSGDEVKEDLKSINLLVSRGIDLLIIAVSNKARLYSKDYLDTFNNIPVPIIMVDRILDSFQGVKISHDDVQGMYNLTNYLLTQNHSNIAYISGDYNMARTQGRTEGFIKAMNDAGYGDLINDDVFEGNYSFRSGYDLFDTIYKRNKYTAIIAANDMMAYGVMKRAHERNIMIPKDISVCGYDNVRFSEMVTPTLTTVYQNMDSLITEINDAMYKILENPNYEENIILDTELIIRDSVKKM